MERVADFLPRTKNVGAAALTKQLYLFLQALGAEDTLNALAETLRAQGRLPEADEVLREWNVVMGLLNQLALLLGTKCSPPPTTPNCSRCCCAPPTWGISPKVWTA